MAALPTFPQVQEYEEYYIGEAHHNQRQEQLAHWQDSTIPTDLASLTAVKYE